MAAMLLLFVQLLDRVQYPEIFADIIGSILEFQQNLLMYSVNMSCVVLTYIQQETKSLDQLNARAMPMFIQVENSPLYLLLQIFRDFLDDEQRQKFKDKLFAEVNKELSAKQTDTVKIKFLLQCAFLTKTSELLQISHMIEQIANIDDTKLNIALLDALVLDFNPDNSEIIEKLLRKTKYAPAILRLQALQPLPIPLAKAINELIKSTKLKFLEKGKFEFQAS